jgi:hypothetical protein
MHHRTMRLLIATAVAMVVSAAPAFAAQRWAAPAATGAGDCSSATNACPLASAVGGSVPSDEVIVGPGDYTLSAAIDNTGKALSIHGEDGMPLPRLHAGSSANLSLASGTSLRRLAIDSSSAGAPSLIAGTDVTLDQLKLTVTVGFNGIDVTGTSRVLDSVVNVASAIAVVSRGGKLTLRNDTVASSSGDAIHIDVGSATAISVIARGGAHDFITDGPSTATATYSNFRPAYSSGMPNFNGSDPSNQTTVDPVFVDSAHGDYHEDPNSPTIDAGAVDSQSGSADLDGNPRSLGAAPDIGAYEYVPRHRYAAPGGVGDCSQAGPCSLDNALTGLGIGDEVVVEPGSYSTAGTFGLPANVSVHGVDGQPAPSVDFTSASSDTALGLNQGDSLSDLRLSRSTGTSGVLRGNYCGVTLDRLDVHVAVANHPGIQLGGVRPGPSSVLRDSLVRADLGGESAVLINQCVLQLRNDTLIAPDPTSTALWIYAFGQAWQAVVKATILRGGGADVHAEGDGGHAEADLSYSNYRPAKVAVVGDGVVVGNGDPSNQLTVDPVFVNAAAGNYREAPGSPTIDAGTIDGFSGPRDLDGASRTLGSAPDIGAYEFAPPPAFVPPPVVSTGAAAAVTGTAATLQGTVDPRGTATTYHFEIGQTTAYDTIVPIPDASAGSDTSAHSETQAVSGLAPGTPYHFRIVASNAGGTTYGVDQTFTTAPPNAKVRPPVLSRLTLAPSRFAPAKSGASIAKRKPTGTKVTYRDSAQATAKLTVKHTVRAVRVGKRCVLRRGPPPKHAKRCSLVVAVGSFTHSDRTGANSFHFTGRVSGKALSPGAYTLVVVAANAGGASKPPLIAHFRILPRA